jgi:hypothetical protein
MQTNSSYNYAKAETKSDTVDFQKGTCDAIFVGTEAGNVTVVLENGDTVLFVAVPVGTILPIRAKRINSTGTGSSTFVALYQK